MSSMSQAASVRNEKGEMPFTHWAVVEAKPGQIQTVQQLGGKFVAPEVAKEEGTYMLYGVVPIPRPDTMILLELYADEAAYEKHVSSDAFHAYEEARKEYLKELHLIEMKPLVLEQKLSGKAEDAALMILEVEPEKVDEAIALIDAEYKRATREDDGVLGLFATSELDAPNVLHILEMYHDKAANEAYHASREQTEFWQKLSAISKVRVRTMPEKANIPLSTRGLKK